MLIYKYIHFLSNNPLSCFPQGGKALLGAPSPMGEGWVGGKNSLRNYWFIYDWR